MNNSKLSKRLILSCFTTTCMLAFILVSCETEEVEPQFINKEQRDLSKKANRPDRIDICHYDEDTGDWMRLTVSAKSWDDHSLHGDQWLDQDGDGFTSANECGIGSMDDCDDTDANVNPDSGCDPKIFAIAYSNLNGEPGFQENSADVLISKVVDFNNDRVVSVGDKVITNQYPKDFEATTFGNFVVKQHSITNVTRFNFQTVNVSSETEIFQWQELIENYEFYFESSQLSFTQFLDSFRGDEFDLIQLHPLSPSQPADLKQILDFKIGNNDTFIDVDILLD